MNEAIKLAIEKGGYNYFPKVIDKVSLEGMLSFEQAKEFSVITQDPLFWQALGKALGWRNSKYPDFEGEWHVIALQFFNLKLTGGDEEKFWKELN